MARLPTFVGLALLVAACSGDGETDSKSANQTPAGCKRVTDFDGDCLALPVPDDDVGMQVRYGPETYSQADLEPFIIEPGEEETHVLYVQAPNDREVYINGYSARVRPGSHHLLVTHYPGETNFFLSETSQLPPLHFNTLFGVQSGSVDVPDPDLPIAEEDKGIAFRLEPNEQIAVSAHFINTGETRLLREAWFNVYYADPAEVTELAAPFFLVGRFGMDIQPKSSELIQGTADVPHDMRIVWMFGHFHTHTTRVSAFVVRKDTGKRETVYQTFDYSAPLYAAYNTVFENPPVDERTTDDGAVSGMMLLKEGDKIEWECQIVNNDDFNLRFSNELYTGEMCAIAGFYTPAPDARPWRVLAL